MRRAPRREGNHVLSGAPKCGSGPSCRLERPPPPHPCALGPLPHASPGCALPEHCKTSQGGGEEEGVGREGLWLKGKVLQCNGQEGGGRPKHTWDQTHIWGSRNEKTEERTRHSSRVRRLGCAGSKTFLETTNSLVQTSAESDADVHTLRMAPHLLLRAPFRFPSFFFFLSLSLSIRTPSHPQAIFS